jgi:hypothetical protein
MHSILMSVILFNVIVPNAAAQLEMSQNEISGFLKTTLSPSNWETVT